MVNHLVQVNRKQGFIGFNRWIDPKVSKNTVKRGDNSNNIP